jgi:hypothetical protein
MHFLVHLASASIDADADAIDAKRKKQSDF